MPASAKALTRRRRAWHIRATARAQIVAPQVEGPINKLPMEILAIIFLSLRDLCCPDSQLGFRPPWIRKAYAWVLSILLVNRKWHEVALGCTQLWNYVEASQPESLLLLHRSKESPLSLGFSPNTFSVIYMFPKPFPDIFNRLKSFSTFGASEWQRAFDGVTALPVLQDLLLEYQPLSLQTSRDLPVVFMSGSLPNIRRVHLTGYMIDWSWSIFPSTLRVLILGGWETAIPHTPVELSFEDTIAALRRLPLLEVLGLHKVVKGTDEDPGYALPPITLIHLRSLSISAPVQVCCQILASIEHPPTTTLDITAVVERDHAAVLHTMALSVLLRNKQLGEGIIGRAKPPSFKGVIFSHRPAFQRCRMGQKIILQCFTDENPCNRLDDSEAENIRLYCLREQLSRSTMAWELECAPGLRLSISSVEDDIFECDDWFQGFCDDWPFHEVETFMLGQQGPTLEAVQEKCPAVTTLLLKTGVSDYDADIPLAHLESLLCYDPEAVTASAPGELPYVTAYPRLPEMKVLVLEFPVKEEYLDALRRGLLSLHRLDAITFERLVFVIHPGDDFNEDVELLCRIGREFGVDVSVYPSSTPKFQLVRDARDKY